MRRLIGAAMSEPLVVALCVAAAVVGGLLVAPFDWEIGLPRDPVAIDAIPDIGENQQIVFTEWPGRSPQDIDDQVSYPLTSVLLALPGVRSVRSQSILGVSSIYVVFEDGVDFYWARSRILEKLASLPPDALPPGVEPTLGPDATALGQIFWYTLEGRDERGAPVGGFELHELRSVQDWTVRFALMGVAGVAEVASIGGHVREFQVDVDPDALRSHGVTLAQVAAAVRGGNADVGARTIEINRAEYIVRSLGQAEALEDLSELIVTMRGGLAVRVGDVAEVVFGPAPRRGALDVAGREAVGGVVVARFGANPMEVLDGVHERIARIAPGLPRRTLDDGTVSRVTIVPFYDRGKLIDETLGTLESAIEQQLLITALVVLLLLARLRSGALVAAMLPLAVLVTFVGMKLLGVTANVVALAGIAIAVGTIVDMGIVLCENVVRRLDDAPPGARRFDVVLDAATEVGGAVLTAVLTTVVGFLPVFAMTGAEGKLFMPLAITKTIVLVVSIVLTLAVLPAAAYRFLGGRRVAGPWRHARLAAIVVAAVTLLVALARSWAPLGPGPGLPGNLLFVAVVTLSFVGGLWLFQRAYVPMLRWALDNKLAVVLPTVALLLMGFAIWLGYPGGQTTRVGRALGAAFPGLGEEFMPALDEGEFLYMPTTMVHASIGEAQQMLAQLDRSIAAIPEVTSVVGKIGRVDSALDPAPLSMIETLIAYAPEYGVDEHGESVRLWRDHIEHPDQIWEEIVAAAQMPGLTSAPRLQPIETRQVMLQSGMRAPFGVKLFGPDLETLDAFGLELERRLQRAPGVDPATVFADRVVGKPYLEIRPDRERLAHYGVRLGDFQQVVAVAVGGAGAGRVIEGRERYAVRVRYQRERRDSVEALGDVLVPLTDGRHLPLSELATIDYVRGPQMIRSEDAFLVAYVTFDALPGRSELEVVEGARAHLERARAAGQLVVPDGVSYRFAGAWENQVRAEKRLSLVLPLALALILIILQLQFRSPWLTLLVFSGIAIAWAGGFVMLWLWGRPGFLDFSVAGTHLGTLFSVGPIQLSIAVWVGFLALFGIASDNGVVLATRLRQAAEATPPATVADVRALTLRAGELRVRACLMSTATTVLALLPVLSSQGRGADVMVPMAIPTVGGMTAALVTLFVVPVLYAALLEARLPRR